MLLTTNKPTSWLAISLAACLAITSTTTQAAPVEQQQITFQQDLPLIQSLYSSPSSKFNQLLDSNLQSELRHYIQSFPEKRFVQIGGFDQELIEITEGEKSLLRLEGIQFMDLTDHLEQDQVQLVQQKDKDGDFPKKLEYSSKDLSPLFKSISLDYMKSFLTKFTTNFRTRHYKSDTGKQSQQFLLQTVKQIISSGKNNKNITVNEFPHPWGQNSIIVRFEPSSSASSFKKPSEEIVILSAHQDSTNLLPWFNAPGADDDGSGTTTLLMTLKVLIEHGFVPSRYPVEFHWYSAEEGGLLGSQAVSQSYITQGKKVKSVLQMDMTAYVKPSTKPTIGIIQDFVSPSLTSFVTLLAKEFSTIQTVETKCSYACSDHASWTKLNVPSSFIIESSFEDSNKNIHSTRDTVDAEGFSFEHMREFVRVCLGLVVSLGGGESLGL